MKFLNGYWLTRSGYTLDYAAEAYRVEAAEGGLRILAPCRKIGHRGDTLGGPVLTVELTAPAPGVIRVRAWHYAPSPAQCAARENASFELNCPGGGAVVEESEMEATLSTGGLTARVAKAGGWSVRFEQDGRLLTASGPKHLGYVQGPEGAVYMQEQLDLGIGECIYGMGERFSPFVKNGQSVDIWNEDGGTNTEQAYKNVPFYLSSAGYGVFVNNPGRVQFEVATEVVSRVQFCVPEEELDYFVIGGPTMKEALTRYTALTGRPQMPPLWSFGLWLSTSFVTKYDEETVNSFVDGMAQRNIPLSVFHFDCFWMREMQWCDFTWDRRLFPEPEEMLRRLKAKGLRICVWINPYVAQQSPLFEEGAEKGFFLKRTDGRIWQWDMWQPGMAIVDFTNPEAREWFTGKLEKLLEMGVDCFKTDFGERIPAKGVTYANGADPARMHNLYTYLYNRTVYECIQRHHNEAVVFARSATAGCQKFPVHWGGDCSANFSSMAETLRGGLSLGLSGFSFWSHDIGGFEDTAPADVYKRWVAFGLLSSHSRLHGNSSYRVPWNFDEEAVDVLRRFTRLKCRLMPYLFGEAREATETGVPMLRAMVLEFENDPSCQTLDRQYMLGDALLAAPVLRADSCVQYYLPQGRWFRLLTGEAVAGGGWRTEQHDFLSLPLLLRPNRLLPLGETSDTVLYDFEKNVTFVLGALDDGQSCSCVVFGKDGEEKLRVTAIREGGKMAFRAQGGKGCGWRVRLLDAEGWRPVQGMSIPFSADAELCGHTGLLLQAEPGTGVLRLTKDIGV